MTDNETNARLSAARMGLLVISLQEFAAQIMAHVLKGGALDDRGLDKIQKATLRGLKTTASHGTSLAQTVAMFKLADRELRDLMAGAIARSRALNSD